MSLLHRSLEQLRSSRPRERGGSASAGGLRGATSQFALASPSRGRSIGLASALMLALGVVALLGVLLVRESRGLDAGALRAGVARLADKAERLVAGEEARAVVPDIAQTVAATVAPAPANAALHIEAPHDARAVSPAPQPSAPPAGRLATVDLAFAPSESLEAYFAAQAKRNQTLLDQERNVAKTFAAGDAAAAQKQLHGYLQRVGENSVAAARWKGYQALKEGRFADAENVYRTLLASRPDDSESAYNFLVALLKQNKKSDAATFHARYMREHSLDERVGGLGVLFEK